MSDWSNSILAGAAVIQAIFAFALWKAGTAQVRAANASNDLQAELAKVAHASNSLQSEVANWGKQTRIVPRITLEERNGARTWAVRVANLTPFGIWIKKARIVMEGVPIVPEFCDLMFEVVIPAFSSTAAYPYGMFDQIAKIDGGPLREGYAPYRDFSLTIDGTGPEGKFTRTESGFQAKFDHGRLDQIISPSDN